MRKYILTNLVFILGFFLITLQPIQAQMDSMMDVETSTSETVEKEAGSHGESIEVVLSEVLAKQQVATISELDCRKVSNDDLERLGDAAMEKMHPDESHEAMDQMMGGEGSESLRQMHINMGKNHLGCAGNYGLGMMGGMMGMMNGSNWNNQRGEGGGSPMMGWGYGNMMGSFGILGGLTWAALIAFLLAGAYYFIKKANKK